MSRRLGFYRRTSLMHADFPSLTEDCYIEWRPLTVLDSLEIGEDAGDLSDITEIAATRKMIERIKKNLVGGKINVFKADGSDELELVDLEPADVAELPGDLIDRIFAEMTGVQYDADPKAEGAQPVPTDTKSVETPSSEDSKSPAAS